MSDDLDPTFYEWDEELALALEDITRVLVRGTWGGEAPKEFDATIRYLEAGYEIVYVGPDGATNSTRIDLASVQRHKEEMEASGALRSQADDNLTRNLSDEPQRPELIIPPGSTLLRWSRFIFPKKFVEGEITHTIDDMQREYIESIFDNRKWHPKWVCVRGYMSYGVCVFCWMLGGVGKRIVDAWKGVNPS